MRLRDWGREWSMRYKKAELRMHKSMNTNDKNPCFFIRPQAGKLKKETSSNIGSLADGPLFEKKAMPGADVRAENYRKIGLILHKKYLLLTDQLSTKKGDNNFFYPVD